MAQWLTNPTRNHEVAGSLASHSGLSIQHCCELWRRSQTWLGSCVAVATAPIRPLAWEPPYAAGSGPRKGKKTKKEEKKKTGGRSISSSP